MKQHCWRSKTASLIVLVYLLLAFLMAMPMEQHSLLHGQSPDHSKEHVNFICTWMCTASSHVHSVDLAQTQQFMPVFEAPIAGVRISIQNKPQTAFLIRPPPFRYT